jgi:hypothetical protein
MNMKHGLKAASQMFLFACLVTGTWALAQDSSAQEPAPDNTKVNERDKSKAEPTADKQKRICPTGRSPGRFAGRSCRTSPYLRMPTTSRSSRRKVW